MLSSFRIDHLTAEQVAAYRDDGLSMIDRQRADQHLTHCPACRREMIEVDRFLTTRSSRRRVWGVSAAGGLLAAALIGIMILRSLDGTPDLEHLRDGKEGIASIERIAPVIPIGSVDRPVRFAWSGVGADAFYRFTLLDEPGARIYSIGTRDVSIVLPESVALNAGSPYHWYVDAILPNGRSITTGLQSFEIRADR